jgi:hypothetical protein
MDANYGSCQNEIETGLHNNDSNNMSAANGTEDLALLRNHHEMTNSESFKTSERTTTSTRNPRRIQTSLLVGLAIWLVVMTAELSPFLFMIATGGYEDIGSTSLATDAGDDDDDALHALWGSTAYHGVYNIRECSLNECLSSPCHDAPSTPFVCLALKHNEQVRGGCGARPWTPEICSNQCDAVGCARLLERQHIPKERAAKKDCDVECPKQWCKRNRLCGDESSPYQCTTGLSMYGCSSDRFEWTLRSTETECSSCCKTTSCDD